MARRGNRRASASQHLHPGLRAEHPLLIGSQDQGLLAGQVVRLGADVPFSIKEQHPQQPACRIEQMHRDDADRALLLYCAADRGKRVRVGAGHGCAGERPCRCAPEKPAARKGRAATRVSPFAVRAPGQTRWGDRKSRWADQRQAGSATSPLPGQRQELLLARSTPLDNLNSCVLSRLGLLLRGQLDELGSFVE